MNPAPTASQTVGPYFHIGLDWLNTGELAAPDSPGEHFKIAGCVLDGDGNPIPDALVEIWQADANGQFANTEDFAAPPPRFRGFGRTPTNAEGRFEFTTIKPGPVPNTEGGMQAPHLLVSVFMRGLLKRAVTRVYFPDEPRNSDDAVLQLVPADRRKTLIARKAANGELAWDIIMQGPNETVFFDC